MYKTSTLIAVLTLACACSPLRKTQTVEHEQTEISDTALTESIRREIEHRFGTLRQTVVEFYPPAEIPPPPDPADLSDTLKAVLPPPKIPARQPVKRITYTEASMQNDRTTLTDSISRSRINTAARSDTQTVTEEKPSSGVVWLKWAALLAGLLLLILLLIKIF
jgi:lipoprotein